MQRDDAAFGQLDKHAANARAADAERFAQDIFGELRGRVQAPVHDRRDDLLDDLILGCRRARELRRRGALDLPQWAVLLDHLNLFAQIRVAMLCNWAHRRNSNAASQRKRNQR